MCRSSLRRRSCATAKARPSSSPSASKAGARARSAGRSAIAIAHSPLVKTAFFASDPNLGRILAAIGYAGVEDLDAAKVDLYIDAVRVAQGGGRDPEYREAQGVEAMKKPEFTVRVVLNRGAARRRSGLATCPSTTSRSTRNTEPDEDRPGQTARAPGRRARAHRAAAAAAAAADRLEGEHRVSLAQGRARPRLAAAGAACAPHEAFRPARHRAADRQGRAEHPPVHRRQAGQQRAADRRARHRQVLDREGPAQQVRKGAACA